MPKAAPAYEYCFTLADAAQTANQSTVGLVRFDAHSAGSPERALARIVGLAGGSAYRCAAAPRDRRGFQEQQHKSVLATAADVAGRAEVSLGDLDNAIATQRLSVETRKSIATDALSDRRDVAVKATWLAIALAKGGRRDEALTVIGPVVALDRELAAKNHGDLWVSVELASVVRAAGTA